MIKIQYTSAIAALFILVSQGFTAEKTQPEQKVETPILAGDSLSVNMDPKPESAEVDTITEAFKNAKVKGFLRYYGSIGTVTIMSCRIPLEMFQMKKYRHTLQSVGI